MVIRTKCRGINEEMCGINSLSYAGGTTAGWVSCFHVLSAYSGYCSRKATRPLPLTLNTPPTSGQWIKGDLTQLNEWPNRSGISVTPGVSCEHAQRVKVTIKYSGSSFSFPAIWWCRQKKAAFAANRQTFWLYILQTKCVISHFNH